MRRFSSHVLLFCANLALASVILEELGIRMTAGWIWVWTVICWCFAGRLAKKVSNSSDSAEPQKAATSEISGGQSQRQPFSDFLEKALAIAIVAFAVYNMSFYVFE